jgi:hypothetical protein
LPTHIFKGPIQTNGKTALSPRLITNAQPGFGAADVCGSAAFLATGRGKTLVCADRGTALTISKISPAIQENVFIFRL